MMSTATCRQLPRSDKSKGVGEEYIRDGSQTSEIEVC